MPGVIKHFYEFGPFRFDADKHRLMRDGQLVHLTPKAADALLVLVQNPGKLLEREALMQAVWAESFVEDANLTVAISHLRKTLGQNGESAEYIETVPRAGYRFVADVREIREEPAPLIIEKRTLSRTVIEEEEVHPATVMTAVEPRPVAAPISSKPRTQNKIVWASAAIALLVLAVMAWFLLEKPEQPSPPVRITSMAVLPFHVIGAKAEDKHQGLGLADTLITRLSNIRDLKVRPTSAVLDFENQEQDSISWGKRSGVDAVMEGTIYRTNDKVRITTRLLRVADGSTLWSAQFERLVHDELGIQNEIATQMVDALAVNLSGNERDALAKRYTENADAYQLYVKGRYEWNKRTSAGMVEADRLFRNAIDKDPSFALAYVGWADVLMMSPANSSAAINALQKALELDPNLAEAHASLGFIRIFHQWNWPAAEAALRKSLEINPGYASAHHWFAQLLAIQERHEEAKSAMAAALEINPLSHNFLADLGQIYYFNREYRKAEEYCRKALELYPEFELAHRYLFFTYLKMGEYDRAAEEQLAAENAHRALVYPSSEYRKQVEASQAAKRTTYHSEGIRRFVEQRIPNAEDGTACSVFSTYYAFLGQKEKALTCIEKSYEARSLLLAFVRADPIFDDLRHERRYQEILRKMNLAK